MKRLDYYWYHKSYLSLLLLPVSWLFCFIAITRRLAYRVGVLTVTDLPVPVIIVGNISVGGTGKTPMVTWLVDFLREQGYRPGIVSRGYGGNANHWPQQVHRNSDARRVGDEAVLLARRCHCPMVVGPDRVAAAQALLKDNDCDVIVADDGLQHYRLGRNVEIVMIDGMRRFGNGHCLPAGPLREPRSRLNSVDLVITNGVAGPREYRMILEPATLWQLGQESRHATLKSYSGQPVHAVAGIGHPQRFFRQLEEHGLQVIEHPYPDHHPFAQEDVCFDDNLPVLMTEKDAVKCSDYANGRQWVVPVRAQLDESLKPVLLRLLNKAGGKNKRPTAT